MSEENVDQTRDFIEAYNRRDFDAAIENFDPTAVRLLDLVGVHGEYSSLPA
jgi:hypothetical protein